MSRQKSIIISITGITIVMLCLLGLTYGYYITNIIGNTNSNSIVLNTTKLELTYAEGEDSNIYMEKIEPGAIGSKTFTVTNTGEETITDYGVYIEDVINTFNRVDDLEITLTCVSNLGNDCNDITRSYPTKNELIIKNTIEEDEIHTYTLVIKYIYSETENQSEDMGKELSGKVQIYHTPEVLDLYGEVTGASEGDYVQINSNPKISRIDENNSFYLTAMEPGTHTIRIYNEDKEGNITEKGSKEIKIIQGTSSNVDGNTITFTSKDKKAKVDIKVSGTSITVSTGTISEWSHLLKDTIIANAKENINGRTIYSETPKTIPGAAASTSTEMTLSKTTDDYGDSYYFRGNVTDNYVTFNNMCWRIVRIQGDGSIKLVLADGESPCSGGTYNTEDASSAFVGNGSSGFSGGVLYSLNNTEGMAYKLNEWYTTNFNGLFDYIKQEKWCSSDISEYEIVIEKDCPGCGYTESYKKFTIDKTASLICEVESTVESSIGVLYVDEIMFAGSIYNENNSTALNNYLKTNASENDWRVLGFQYLGEISMIHKIYKVAPNGNVGSDTIESSSYYRPSIVLIPGVYASGNGTLEKPYIID